MDELINLLKSLLGEEVKDEELAKAKELSDEASKAIKGALNILSKFKDDMPEDVLAAIKTLARSASYGYPEKKAAAEELSKEEIEKVGARFSKLTLEQLKVVKEALGAIDLKGLKKAIEVVDQLISGAADISKRADLAGLSEEQRQTVIEAEQWKKEQLRKSADENLTTVIKTAVGAALDERIKPIREDLDKVMKQRGVKKSLEGQTTDDKGDSDKDHWPSLG